MSHATIVDHKLAFLQSQTRALTKAIAPSETLLGLADEGGVTNKILRDVLTKVNVKLQRHGREFYSNQMTMHIADQIDLLYHDTAAPSLDGEGDVGMDAGGENTALQIDDDLTIDENIAKLPIIWNSATNLPSEHDQNDVEGQMAYRDAKERLANAAARRSALQKKFNTIRTLKAALEPLNNPRKNVQPNLVTQDGPLALELAQTKILAARVAGRVGENYGDIQVPATAEDSDDEFFEEDGNAKLKKVLDTW